MSDRPQRPLVVIDVVGLSASMLDARAPRLRALAEGGRLSHLEEIYPALTCSAQSSMLTGALPSEHGIVANGWYFRDLAEVWLWRQSNHLVGGESLWDAARARFPKLRCAKMFWWYNMYAPVDVSMTPRPMYPADGRKLPDVYAEPPELRTRMQGELGTFPLFNFWGPTANLKSSEWIAKASARVFAEQRPDLMLVYLPHLDYDLQRYGPSHPIVDAAIGDIDRVTGDLIDTVRGHGARVMVLSEYGIEAATGVVHVNRVLREAGFLRVREEMGLEKLDPGACEAFAVADHQIAHVYVRDPSDVPRVRALLEQQAGIERVLGDDDGSKAAEGLAHPRSGELVCVPEPGHWFTYYFWLDDQKAPDYARCVDIHRKPGYDPVELFLDAELRAPKLRVAGRLAQKLAGFRYLMDVIGLDASVVKGTHGRRAQRPEDGAVLITESSELDVGERFPMTGVKQLILDALALS